MNTAKEIIKVLTQDRPYSLIYRTINADNSVKIWYGDTYRFANVIEYAHKDNDVIDYARINHDFSVVIISE